MEASNRLRLVKSALWLDGDNAAFALAETPKELAQLVREGVASGEPLIEVTLANDTPEWNGRSAFISPRSVRSITPPMNSSEDEDDDEEDDS